MLDRFHFGRDAASLFRRHGGGGGSSSPGPYERREGSNGHGPPPSHQRDPHRDSPTATRNYEKSNRRSPFERDDRSSPNPHHHQQHHHQQSSRSQYNENRHSPNVKTTRSAAGDSMHRTPAIVLSTNYLPTGSDTNGTITQNVMSSSSPSSPTQQRHQRRHYDRDNRNREEEDSRSEEPVCYMYRLSLIHI